MRIITNTLNCFTLLFLYTNSNAQTFNWAGTYGGQANDVVSKIHVDNEGNIYSTGFYAEDCDFDPTEGSYILQHSFDTDIFVSKINKNGELIWAKSIGGTANDAGRDISTDADGNVYITGTFVETVDFDPGAGVFQLTSLSQTDIFILKLDKYGNFIWAKSFEGDDIEQTVGIELDYLGNIYIAGDFNSTTDFDPSASDFHMTPKNNSEGFLVKLSRNGDFIWAKQYGGPGIVTAMKVLSNGDTYISGLFDENADFNPNENEDFFLNVPKNYHGMYLLRLDSNGNFIKANTIATTDFQCFTMGLDFDSQGAIIMTGYFSGKIQFEVPNNTVTSSILRMYYNSFVVKVNPNGQNEWAKILSSDLGFNTAMAIGINAEDEALIYGYYAGTFSSDQVTLSKFPSDNNTENYLLKVSNDGITKTGLKFGGAMLIYGCAIYIDKEEHIYLSSGFQNTVDLNPLFKQTLQKTAIDMVDSYIIKLNDDILSVPDFSKHNTWSFYPNPTHDKIMIVSKTTLIEKKYHVFDMAGKSVILGVLDASQSIDVSQLAAGMYHIKIENTVYKLIKY
ncbi:T9SS type A sorting domain-containing protein [Mariniflexile gromovii]|uniref:T9SS type A sorting domain-containing protein n=1 Tax=Mariniflexile gromovii TaxID=362523 RepID=A0ABS4BVM0_9FLAO|nr:T9SS type A sorting domain-containing protein [Mariniflexile gromovii]MBP0904061.1 T9SS type A sorting domain-containing protein [Mariniflexile gromovii]